jgi:XRE family transcriptional regulator, regulator of sulfur utilization
MTLGATVAAERKRRGISQEELADLAQVSLRTIQRIEREESVPRGFTLKAIAQALGQSVEDFSALPAASENSQTMVPAPAQTPSPPSSSLPASAYLQQLNLSAFSFLLFPYLGFLVPLWLRKKQKAAQVDHPAGARIINFQLMWCIGLHLTLLGALLVQLAAAHYFKLRFPFLVVGCFFTLYLVNIFTLVKASLQLRRGNTQVYQKWGNLFLH